jgi:hypothetical protein
MHMGGRKQAGANRANVLDQKESSRAGSLKRISAGEGRKTVSLGCNPSQVRKPETEGF